MPPPPPLLRSEAGNGLNLKPLLRSRSISNIRDGVVSYSTTRMEESFWNAVFGIVAIRNHSEVDYADLQHSDDKRESIEQSLEVWNTDNWKHSAS